jgi:hypothetical protein
MVMKELFGLQGHGIRRFTQKNHKYLERLAIALRGRMLPVV